MADPGSRAKHESLHLLWDEVALETLSKDHTSMEPCSQTYSPFGALLNMLVHCALVIHISQVLSLTVMAFSSAVVIASYYPYPIWTAHLHGTTP